MQSEVTQIICYELLWDWKFPSRALPDIKLDLEFLEWTKKYLSCKKSYKKVYKRPLQQKFA